MEPTRLPSDLYVNGTVNCTGLSIPANSVTDAAIPAGANISYLKSEQLKQATYNQPNTAATSETRVMHVVRGVGGATILEILCGAIVAAIGAATVTVDLRKNGVTILTGVITLDSTTAAYVSKFGTIATPALVQGDVLSLVIVATAGGGTLPTGFFAQVRVSEKPA